MSTLMKPGVNSESLDETLSKYAVPMPEHYTHLGITLLRLASEPERPCLYCTAEGLPSMLWVASSENPNVGMWKNALFVLNDETGAIQ